VPHVERAGDLDAIVTSPRASKNASMRVSSPGRTPAKLSTA
jgi:hypothetical protein